MISTDYLDQICPLPPLPGALPRVVVGRDAPRYGVSKRSAERHASTGRWRRLLPGVYLTVPGAPTELDRWVAALLFAGAGGTLSGAAALRVVGVRGIAVPSRLLVLVPPPNRKESIGFVQVRRTLRPVELAAVPGPRCAAPARAVADLCLTLSRLDDARAAVGKVVQQGHATVEDIGLELAAGPRQHSRNLRMALEEVGWGAESAPEARALRLLKSAGVAGFIPNVWLQLLDGSWRRVDAYWPRLRFSLEMDGKEWHFRVDRWAKGLSRDVALAKIGVYGVHRPPSALRDEAGFIADVLALLAARERDLRMGLGEEGAGSEGPRWGLSR